MIFDPVQYLMTQEARRREIETHHAIEIARIQNAIGNHANRLDLLERWQRSTARVVRRWPYIVIPIGLIGLNVAPDETVSVIGATIKALL
jgi:hypothetical protein